MKYKRGQFSDEYYQLWKKGALPPDVPGSIDYVVKCLPGGANEYLQVRVPAASLPMALEQACYIVATKCSLRPEDIDLHSVYDLQGDLLWGDNLAYALVNSKSDSSQMSRREFVASFGFLSVALLFGFRPKTASAATTSVSLSGTASGMMPFSDEVFSTYLYVGNGSTQAIVNEIDLLGKGGMVWHKARSGAYSSQLYDTVRGAGNYLISNAGNIQSSSTYLTSFTSNGFVLGYPGGAGGVNENGTTYTSWTFRKASKFFDVVTYTGDGMAGRTISHSLGVAPGMIIVKITSGGSSDSWVVWHRSTSTGFLLLNASNAMTTFNAQHYFGNGTVAVDPTASVFTVGANNMVNTNGATYVAYLFAHDSSADGIVQCGSFTTDAGGDASVNLGWEPQYVMLKSATSVASWGIVDSMRGLSMTSAQVLNSDTANTEVSATWMKPTATGFNMGAYVTSNTVIYLAIRRPNKPPTVGTQVYDAITATAAVNGRNEYNISFVPDFVIGSARVAETRCRTTCRLVGGFTSNNPLSLYTNTINAEGNADSNADWLLVSNRNTNLVGGGAWYQDAAVFHCFRRAPGFMDIVSYNGTGVSGTLAHSLGVVPELMIVKRRNGLGHWNVLHASIGATKVLYLNTTDMPEIRSDNWNNTEPTASVFTVGTNNGTNASASSYIAYLFSSLPGISKVGSYAGNGGAAGSSGTSQTINCGFTSGARFILIKRTDAVGDWYVWDSVRGIGTGNDPHLSLNTTAVEVTTDDSVGGHSSGFTVTQNSATNINVSGGVYIFLAVS